MSSAKPTAVCRQTDHEIPPPLGWDGTMVRHGLDASSEPTWSAIRNTGLNIVTDFGGRGILDSKNNFWSDDLKLRGMSLLDAWWL